MRNLGNKGDAVLPGHAKVGHHQIHGGERHQLQGFIRAGNVRAADLLAHYEKKILLGRVGTPEDCSGAVVFLCSDAARYITGEIMVIDGGLTVTQIGKK